MPCWHPPIPGRSVWHPQTLPNASALNIKTRWMNNCCGQLEGYYWMKLKDASPAGYDAARRSPPKKSAHDAATSATCLHAAVFCAVPFAAEGLRHILKSLPKTSLPVDSSFAKNRSPRSSVGMHFSKTLIGACRNVSRRDTEVKICAFGQRLYASPCYSIMNRNVTIPI